MSAADERLPLHEATLRLLNLLASSLLEQDLLQQGIEALAAILQVSYGAIGLVDDSGKLQQFVYTGISPEEAARIGKPPEGRGLLGVAVPLRLADMSRDSRSVGFPPHHPPMQSLLSMAFSHKGRNYGRVYLSEKLDGSNFSKEDELLLSHFAGVFAMMLAYHHTHIEREHAVETLRESEERFRAIFEQAAIGVAEIDSHTGQFLRINQRYCDIIGYTPHEMLGRTFQDITHTDDLADDLANMERLRRGEIREFTMEKRYHHRDGSIVWVTLTVSPRWKAGDAPTTHIAVVQDVTERKQAEEIQHSSLEALRLLHGIFANPRLSFESKIREMLAMGCQRFGLPIGILARVEGDRYEVIEIVAPGNTIAKGNIFPLGKTYCNVTLKTDGPVGFEHAANSEWKSHPCYQEFKLEAYLAIAIHVGGRPYGTINFSSLEPRKLLFSATDRELLKLMTQWIGSELANQQAEAEKRKLSSVVEQTADSVVITDPGGVIQYINPACQSITGYSPEEAIGNTPRLFKSGQHSPEFYRRLWETITSGAVFRESFINRKKDGSLHHEEKTITPLKNECGEITHFVSTGKDITQRVVAEKTLRENNQLLERIFDSTHFCLAYLDRDFNFIRVNLAYAKTGGFLPDYFPGKNHFHLYPHAENEAIFRRVVQTGEPYTAIAKPFEFPDHPEWGVTYWDWTLHPLKDESGNVEAALFVLLDVTERRRTEDQLNALAYYDALTGLPNRQQLHDHLQWAMKEAANRERLVAILFLDLDRFKNINDTLGHDVGDALLKEVATRLMTGVRPGDTISRLGGDEFTIVLANVAHVDDVTRVAQKLLDHFMPPFRIAGHDLFVSPSIGITLYPIDSDNAENLLKNADIAMYHAKELGRNNFQFYTPELNVRAARRLELETGLRRALERSELVLHFQPLVTMDNGKITGMEALLRWQHPEYGLIPPMEFIPLAEETGLIVPIGEWVLRAACARIKAWHDAGFPKMNVAVNLSSVQLQQKNFVSVVKQALKDTGLEPRYLDLELTETLLMQDMEAAETVLKELHALGVLFSLDDFGTGYSSLSYLRRFPIDFLKIDRSFVRDINHDRYGAGIVRAIIAMAHTLGIKVIAEGVETAAHFRFLRQQGCDISQGYYCSRPLAAEAFTELLRDWRHIRPGKCSLEKTARKARGKKTATRRRARR